MSSVLDTAHVCRFATFEVNIATGELRKHGIQLRIQDQPLRLLTMLLARPGELVTREELRKGLWSETHVEFDTALNSTVKRLRNVLNDSAENSRFIQTVGSRGYRFIYPVEVIRSLNPEGEAASGGRRSLPLRPVTFAAVILAACVLLVASLYLRSSPSRNVGPTSIRSIAVLPLESLSSDPSQAYFADGLTDQLITNLGQLSNVRVISRTSIMQYRGTHKPLPQIARELNVDAVVEGTILRSDNRVRITAQLIQAPIDRHLWAQSYDGDLRDALSLQERVAEDIANHIQAHLTVQPQDERKSSAQRVNSEAYDAYLQARYFEEQHTPEALQKAIEHFREAIQRDPNYALAYVGLANSYNELSYRDVSYPGQVSPIAQQAAQKALQLDDRSAEAHTTMALIGWTSFAWDRSRAERELQRAIQLNPSYASAHDIYAWVLSAHGRADVAIAEAKRALELDPLSVTTRSHLGDAYYFARDYKDSKEEYHRALELYPSSSEPNQDLMLGYLVSGMSADFLVQAERWMNFSGEASSKMAAAKLHQLDRGDYRRGVRVLIQQALVQRKIAYASSTWIATLYAQNRETEQALAWLETAYGERDPSLLYIDVDPAFDSLRSDHQFQRLAARIQ